MKLLNILRIALIIICNNLLLTPATGAQVLVSQSGEPNTTQLLPALQSRAEVIVLTGDYSLGTEFDAYLGSPLPITWNVTITGQPGELPVLDLQAKPGVVEICATCVFRFINISIANETSRGTGTIVSIIRGRGSSRVVFENGYGFRIACSATEPALAIINTTQRSPSYPYPGGQQLARAVDVVYQGKAYYNMVYITDSSSDVPLQLSTGGYYSGGYALLRRNATRLCEYIVPAECIRQFGPEVCVEQFTKGLTTPATAGDASKAVAIAVPTVIGVLLLLGVIGGVVFWKRRKRGRRLQQEGRLSFNSKDSTGSIPAGLSSDERSNADTQPRGSAGLRTSVPSSGSQQASVSAPLLPQLPAVVDGSFWELAWCHTAPSMAWAADDASIELGPLLGAGSFARVYKAKWAGLDVAVKVIQHDSSTIAVVANEVKLSMHLNHPNIVRAYHCITKQHRQQQLQLHHSLSSHSSPPQPQPAVLRSVNTSWNKRSSLNSVARSSFNQQPSTTAAAAAVVGVSRGLAPIVTVPTAALASLSTAAPGAACPESGTAHTGGGGFMSQQQDGKLTHGTDSSHAEHWMPGWHVQQQQQIAAQQQPGGITPQQPGLSDFQPHKQQSEQGRLSVVLPMPWVEVPETPQPVTPQHDFSSPLTSNVATTSATDLPASSGLALLPNTSSSITAKSVPAAAGSVTAGPSVADAGLAAVVGAVSGHRGSGSNTAGPRTASVVTTDLRMGSGSTLGPRTNSLNAPAPRMASNATLTSFKTSAEMFTAAAAAAAAPVGVSTAGLGGTRAGIYASSATSGLQEQGANQQHMTGRVENSRESSSEFGPQSLDLAPAYINRNAHSAKSVTPPALSGGLSRTHHGVGRSLTSPNIGQQLGTARALYAPMIRPGIDQVPTPDAGAGGNNYSDPRDYNLPAAAISAVAIKTLDSHQAQITPPAAVESLDVPRTAPTDHSSAAWPVIMDSMQVELPGSPQTVSAGADDIGLACETWLVTELCDRGTLARTAADWRPAQEEEDMMKLLLVLQDVARGLKLLHAKNVVHADLNAHNVLVSSSSTARHGLVAKIADLGLSRIIQQQATHRTTKTIGTLSHQPPELLQDGRSSTAVDVYSFGIMMWELYTGEAAFARMRYGQIYNQVVLLGARPAVPADMWDDYHLLMARCWAAAPEQRPSVDMLLDCLTLMIQDRELQTVQGVTEYAQEV